MSEIDSHRPAESPDNGSGGSRSARFGPQDGRRVPQFWHMARWLGLRIAALLGGFSVFAILLVGGAGWYTSRPEFCRSCHIMEPYYHSWEVSTHRDVSCIDCHFSPGFGGKLRGKMLGLVQLAKYVTASEGPRPAAEIPDASCLRSGCHETRLLSGKVDFHGIAFDHTPHLGDLRRGKKLRCTSCHSQIVQGKHMTVTTTTCFLCHFKEGVFNEGLGACTRCHQIPDKKFDLGGGVMFSHDLAYERGVDCENCHGDLIRGRGEVPRERCGVCHNRPEDLAKIDDHVFLHQKHVTDHKVDCMDCHLTIDHSLDRMKIEHAASDCASCHPDHHRDQVNMLRGMGGKSIPPQSNGMQSVRVECRTCHRFKQEGPTGAVLWKASIEVCTSCHDASSLPRFQAYQERLKAGLEEMESSAKLAREALTTAKLPEAQATSLADRLETIQHDLAFLRSANGIHNVHYATTLTSTALERLTAMCRELKLPEPKVELPPFMAPAKAAPGKPSSAEPGGKAK
jgi:nitrate/TMAO reductase-like tetraheme cytochrome c subunit